MKSHYQILIIGGGTAGIMTATSLLSKNKKLDIALLEPSQKHFYQPAWTLVGAGAYSFKRTEKLTHKLIPRNVTWIQDYAIKVNPEQNMVETKSTGILTYDYLVIATGLVMEPSLIEGLPEALANGTVCSNYINPEYTWEVLQNFKGGNAIFTQPTTPIKCGGAPQKIAYLAADYFKRKKIASRTNLIFATPGSVIFGVKPIRETLMHVIDRYQILFRHHWAPVKIDAKQKKVFFKYTGEEENECILTKDTTLQEESSGNTIIELPFDMLHLAPPQAAPKFIRESVLSSSSGWLAIDHHSMQHKKFSNIFGLGDVADLPTAKTGAAVRKQVPVVVTNILHLIATEKISDKKYNGYSSCPLVTGYNKMVLAEFDYTGNFTPDPKLKQLLIFNSDKEHRRLWFLKKYGLPYLYWKKMMRGKEV
ncbi:NAD(P)/FAD-dependent oxidoreductase [Aquimarina rhabdastrellae]